MSIVFLCYSCNKQIRVGDELAGRKAKCPKCKAVLRIPEQPNDARPVAKKKYAKSSPLSSSTPSKLFNFFSGGGGGAVPVETGGEPAGGGFDFAAAAAEEPTAAYRRKNRGSWKAVLATFLVLAVSAGVAGWLLRDEITNLFLPSPLEADLRYLPDNAQLIAAFNAEKVRDSKMFEKFKSVAQEAKIPLDADFGRFGPAFTFDDVRRLSLGLRQDGDHVEAVVVVRLGKDVEAEAIRKGLFADPSKAASSSGSGGDTGSSGKEKRKAEWRETKVATRAGEVVVHHDFEAVFCMPNARTLVLAVSNSKGTDDLDKREDRGVELLRGILERGKKAELSGPMARAAMLAGGQAESLVVALEPNSFTADLMKQTGPALPLEANQFKGVEALLVTARTADDFTLKLAALCEDADKAESFKDEGAKSLKILQQFVKGIAGNDKFADALGKVEFTQEDSRVWAELQLEPSAALPSKNQLVALRERFDAGGGSGPPPPPGGMGEDAVYFPNNARVVIRIDFGRILTSSLFRALKKLGEKHALDIEKEFEKAVEIFSAKDLDSMTIAISGDESFPTIGIVRLKKSVEKADLEKTLADNVVKTGKPRPMFQDLVVGKETFRSDGEGAYLMPTPTTVVGGKVPALRAVVERGSVATLPDQVKASLEEAKRLGSAAYIVFDVKAVRDAAKTIGGVEAPKEASEAIEAIDGVALLVDLGVETGIDLLVRCTDEKAARDLRDKADAMIKLGQGLVGGMGEVPQPVKDLLGNVVVHPADGRGFQIAVKASADTWIEAVQHVIKSAGAQLPMVPPPEEEVKP